MKALTKGELRKISKRIDEIDSILELCDDTYDGDVIENLESELEYWCEVLESSEKLARRREIGLRLVV